MSSYSKRDSTMYKFTETSSLRVNLLFVKYTKTRKVQEITRKPILKTSRPFWHIDHQELSILLELIKVLVYIMLSL